VHSIEALKELRVALALFGDDALSALGAVDMEVRRTMQWLQQDRRMYWADQIKRRREQVAMAQAEVFRRKLTKTPEHSPSFSEQKELLRRAEASLRDAETRAALVKKWEPALQQAVFEYHGTTRRIKDLASGDVPRGMVLLERMIDALEAYLRVAPPSGGGGLDPLESIASSFLSEEATSTAAPTSSDQAGDASEVPPPEPGAAAAEPVEPAPTPEQGEPST
jgi:hypothetical protein